MSLSGLPRAFTARSTFNPDNINVNSTAITWTSVSGSYTLGTAGRNFSVGESRNFATNTRTNTVVDGPFTTTYNSDRNDRLNSFINSMSGASQQREFVYLINIDHVRRVNDTINFGNQAKMYLSDISYDTAGNISQINNTRENAIYTYDSMGRLIREEDVLTNRALEYNYNSLNNLTQVREFRAGAIFNTQTFATTGDRITDFTNTNPQAGSNMSFEYDAMGNPTRYGNRDMTWTRGRLLHTIVPSNGAIGSRWEYLYDENGIRYRKIERNSSGTIINTTNYYADGTRIIAEESVRYGLIEYFYDGTGVIGMRRNNTNFLYVKDVLGNIIEVIRQDGVTVARYAYDAWGNSTIAQNVDNMAHINPFRYRGYYRDRGTGFYYLQTRYYDPAIRRFINADNYKLVPALAGQRGGLNMYAYALNNPVSYVDPSGQFAITIAIVALVGIIALCVIGTGYVLIENTDWAAVGNDLANAWTGLTIAWGALTGWVGGLWASSSATSVVVAPNENIGIVPWVVPLTGVMEYQRRRPAVRDRSNTRRAAREKAQRRGGGRPPRGPHKHDDLPPHFHPDVPKDHPFRHDHYYFPDKFFIFLPPLPRNLWGLA